MKNTLLIYNPAAGGGAILKSLDYIISRLSEKNIVTTMYRLTKFDSLELLSVLSEKTYDFIMISGGDGTLGYVTNILLTNNIDTKLGLIPLGTCNDFTISLGLCNEIEKCLDIILKGKAKDIDALLMNDKHYFTNTFAMGMFADISFTTDNNLKKALGPFAYYINGIYQLGKIKSFNAHITGSGVDLKEELILLLALNGTRGAGFSNIMKHADISDGLIDVLAIKKCSHVDLGSIFLQLVNNQDICNDRNVISIKAHELFFELDKKVPVSIDGENLKEQPTHLKIADKKLKIFL